MIETSKEAEFLFEAAKEASNTWKANKNNVLVP